MYFPGIIYDLIKWSEGHFRKTFLKRGTKARNPSILTQHDLAKKKHSKEIRIDRVLFVVDRDLEWQSTLNPKNREFPHQFPQNSSSHLIKKTT